MVLQESKFKITIQLSGLFVSLMNRCNLILTSTFSSCMKVCMHLLLTVMAPSPSFLLFSTTVDRIVTRVHWALGHEVFLGWGGDCAHKYLCALWSAPPPG